MTGNRKEIDPSEISASWRTNSLNNLALSRSQILSNSDCKDRRLSDADLLAIMFVPSSLFSSLFLGEILMKELTNNTNLSTMLCEFLITKLSTMLCKLSTIHCFYFFPFSVFLDTKTIEPSSNYIFQCSAFIWVRLLAENT